MRVQYDFSEPYDRKCEVEVVHVSPVPTSVVPLARPDDAFSRGLGGQPTDGRTSLTSRHSNTHVELARTQSREDNGSKSTTAGNVELKQSLLSSVTNGDLTQDILGSGGPQSANAYMTSQQPPSSFPDVTMAAPSAGFSSTGTMPLFKRRRLGFDDKWQSPPLSSFSNTSIDVAHASASGIDFARLFSPPTGCAAGTYQAHPYANSIAGTVATHDTAIFADAGDTCNTRSLSSGDMSQSSSLLDSSLGSAFANAADAVVAPQPTWNLITTHGALQTAAQNLDDNCALACGTSRESVPDNAWDIRYPTPIPLDPQHSTSEPYTQAISMSPVLAATTTPSERSASPTAAHSDKPKRKRSKPSFPAQQGRMASSSHVTKKMKACLWCAIQKQACDRGFPGADRPKNGHSKTRACSRCLTIEGEAMNSENSRTAIFCCFYPMPCHCANGDCWRCGASRDEYLSSVFKPYWEDVKARFLEGPEDQWSEDFYRVPEEEKSKASVEIEV